MRKSGKRERNLNKSAYFNPRLCLLDAEIFKSKNDTRLKQEINYLILVEFVQVQ
jgi:hypothetical protein